MSTLALSCIDFSSQALAKDFTEELLPRVLPRLFFLDFPLEEPYLTFSVVDTIKAWIELHPPGLRHVFLDIDFTGEYDDDVLMVNDPTERYVLDVENRLSELRFNPRYLVEFSRPGDAAKSFSQIPYAFSRSLSCPESRTEKTTDSLRKVRINSELV